MKDAVYALGRWQVKQGLEAEFIEAWKELGDIFLKLPNPPSGKGTLLQSLTDSCLFYSFGPWQSIEAIQAMRENPLAQAGIARLLALCAEGIPGSFKVVAET